MGMLLALRRRLVACSLEKGCRTFVVLTEYFLRRNGGRKNLAAAGFLEGGMGRIELPTFPSQGSVLPLSHMGDLVLLTGANRRHSPCKGDADC